VTWGVLTLSFIGGLLAGTTVGMLLWLLAARDLHNGAWVKGYELGRKHERNKHAKP